MVNNKLMYYHLLLLGLLFASVYTPEISAQQPESEIEKVRQARDLMNNRQYEAAYKILEPMDLENCKARYRLAVLIMTKDDANPYYDLRVGCLKLRGAAEYCHEARSKFAYAEMLTLSPYLRLMPDLMAKETFEWYLASAELGYAPAQQKVGEILANDSMPQADSVQAYMWLVLAHNRYAGQIKNGKGDYQKAQVVMSICRNMIDKKKISPRQVKKAHKMARKWEKKHLDAYKSWPIADQDY